jgi:hypothetical protein
MSMPQCGHFPGLSELTSLHIGHTYMPVLAGVEAESWQHLPSLHIFSHFSLQSFPLQLSLPSHFWQQSLEQHISLPHLSSCLQLLWHAVSPITVAIVKITATTIDFIFIFLFMLLLFKFKVIYYLMKILNPP